MCDDDGEKITLISFFFAFLLFFYWEYVKKMTFWIPSKRNLQLTN